MLPHRKDKIHRIYHFPAVHPQDRTNSQYSQPDHPLRGGSAREK